MLSHLGREQKRHREMSNLIFMDIFVSAYVETSLGEGSKPPVCIVWTLSAVTNLVQRGTVFGKLMNGAMGVHVPCVIAEFKDVPCWCKYGLVGEEGNVQSRKTRSGLNISSNVCMYEGEEG